MNNFGHVTLEGAIELTETRVNYPVFYQVEKESCDCYDEFANQLMGEQDRFFEAQKPQRPFNPENIKI